MLLVRFKLFAIVSFLACVNPAFSECPQHTFENSSVVACNKKCPVTVALDVTGCIGPDLFFEDPKVIVVASSVPVWRRGAISNLEKLENLFGGSSNISKLYPGVFLNLPKLDIVGLYENHIEEILWGVFSNSSTRKLDLHDNYISFIEREAFSDMPNLEILDLKTNRLQAFQKSWFKLPRKLSDLILSHNQIEKIEAESFDIFPSLSTIDLSFNRIKEIGRLAFHRISLLKLLDLTGNSLTWLEPNIFKITITVEVLRLTLNKFSFLSTDVLDNGSVKSIALDLNPWQCPCLDVVHEWMRSHRVTVAKMNQDIRLKYNGSSLPQCVINSKHPTECVVEYDDAYQKAQGIYLEGLSSILELPASRSQS